MGKQLEHFFIALFSSERGPYPWGRRILFLLCGLTLAVEFYQFLQFAGDSYKYPRDYWQDYLMAKAFLLGFDPYQPISKLPSLLGIELRCALFNHPSPHPPLLVLLNLPFAFLSPSLAQQLLMGLQFGMIWLSAGILLDLLWGKEELLDRRRFQSLIFFLLFLFPSMQGEFLLGQFNLLIVYLLLCSLRFERDSRHVFSGLLLAVALSLKASFALVGFAFLFSGKWKTLLSFGLVFFFLHLLLISVFGLDLVKNYYLVVAPLVTNYYALSPDNNSLWVILANIFFGAKHFFSTSFNLPPCLPSEFQVYYNPLRYLVFALAAVAIFLSLRLRTFTLRFLYLLGLSALLSPIVWEQGLLYVLPLMFYLWVDWFKRGAGGREFAGLLLLSLFCLYYVPLSSIGQNGELVTAASCMPDLLIAKQAFFKIAACLLYFYLRYATPAIQVKGCESQLRE